MINDLKKPRAHPLWTGQVKPWKENDVKWAKQDRILLNAPGRKTEFGLGDGYIRITPEGGFGNFYLQYDPSAKVESVVIDAMSALGQRQNKEHSVGQSWLENQSMFYQRSGDSMLKMNENFQGKEVWELMR